MKMRCDSCRREFEPHELDAKPRLGPVLLIVRLFRGRAAMMDFAGDRGYDFNRMECRDCYGPGFSEF